MLAEFLEGRGDWAQVMPGARACLFSLHDEPVSLPLRLEPLHFEALFCLAGSITLTRRDNTILTASVRQVLLLTDLSDLSGASVDAPLAGILVAVEGEGCFLGPQGQTMPVRRGEQFFVPASAGTLGVRASGTLRLLHCGGPR